MNSEKEIESLVSSFIEYRNLLTPIEQSLRTFADTYEDMRNNINELNKSFGSNMQGKLEDLFNDLNAKFEKSKSLMMQLDLFRQKTDSFASQIDKLSNILELVGNKISKIDEIENRATTQIEKLDEIIEQKSKVYNIKELEKSLDLYNANVQKITDYINKDIANELKDNNEKIASIKDKNESIYQILSSEKSSINDLINAYTDSNNLIKTMMEKQDINEQIIFDVLDKWAVSRGVKTKK